MDQKNREMRLKEAIVHSIRRIDCYNKGMNRLIQAVAFLVIIAVVWGFAGDKIMDFIGKRAETIPASSRQSELSVPSTDADTAYWEAFWKLYPDGYGFGSREAMESLPSFGITDPVLQDLHDVCIRYFDDMDQYRSGMTEGEANMNQDMIKGRWSRDFMPLLRKAKEKYGVPD